MCKKYSLLALILIASPNFFYTEAYGSPIAFTESDPLTPLDPMGNHLGNRLEPLYKSNNMPRQQARKSNGVASHVLDTYKRNLDEAMGKRTLTPPKSATSTKITSTTITASKQDNDVKIITTDKTQKIDDSKIATKTQGSSQTTSTITTDQKPSKKTDEQKTITTTEEKYIKKDKTANTTDKQNEKVEQKMSENENTHKDSKNEKKEVKKPARKLAYDGARPQLWYGGPWHHG